MAISPPILLGTLGMDDTLLLMVLALVLLGPKRLPMVGRQIGKLMYEFRKASNDFKYQLEEELRNAEEADRRKREEAQRALTEAQTAAAQAQSAAEEAIKAAQAARSAAESAQGAADVLPAGAEAGGAAEAAVVEGASGAAEPEPEPERGLENSAETHSAQAASETPGAALRVQPPATGEQAPRVFLPGHLGGWASQPEPAGEPAPPRQDAAAEEQTAATESTAQHG